MVPRSERHAGCDDNVDHTRGGRFVVYGAYAYRVAAVDIDGGEIALPLGIPVAAGDAAALSPRNAHAAERRGRGRAARRVIKPLGNIRLQTTSALFKRLERQIGEHRRGDLRLHRACDRDRQLDIVHIM